MPKPRRSTPAGQHRPVLLDEVLRILDPQPGHVVVDCTLGFGGHAAALLTRIGPTGLLIGLDADGAQISQARQRLEAVGHPFQLHHANFAGLDAILAGARADAVLADLGMSSMQVDDPERGFSYVRDGPLDMRMDQTRGRSAAQLLEIISASELSHALAELGDEADAARIAQAIVHARDRAPILRTAQLATIIQEATGQSTWSLRPKEGKWQIHPAARTFQALRLLVNRELGSLGNLMRVLPYCLRDGGKAAVISFHSGEDRLVKGAFRDGLRQGVYEAISPDPIRTTFSEQQSNPRSRSAKLRWAKVSARARLDL